MQITKSFMLCFAMFSRIPVPKTDWTKDNMRFIMAFFPLVGLVVGLIVCGWGYLAEYLSFSSLLSGVGLTCLPVLLTGGIHLDGYCDTIDALSSHAESERKQQILKDPHIGAFAAIFLTIYILVYTALAAEAVFSMTFLLCYLLLHILSRAFSGLAIVFFPCARDSGLAHTFSDAAARKANGIVLGAWSLLSAGLLLITGGPGGMTAVLLALFILLLYRRVAARQFGGISGDLAGWFLQLCELAGLAALALLPLKW